MPLGLSDLFSSAINRAIRPLNGPKNMICEDHEDASRPVLRDIGRWRRDARHSYDSQFTQHCSRCRFY